DKVRKKDIGDSILRCEINSGKILVFEGKGLGAAIGAVLLTPNERQVDEDGRNCYWLYVVTNCNEDPRLEEPIKYPARFPWHEVTKVAHYWLEVDAMTRPVRVSEPTAKYRADTNGG